MVGGAEECDDGNSTQSDGCLNDCTVGYWKSGVGYYKEAPAESCSLEGTLKSVSSSVPTPVAFVNTSTTDTFIVYWLNYSGQRVWYATVAPGKTWSIPSFVTHPWLIADSVGTCAAIFQPLTGGEPTWMRGPPKP